MQFLRGIVVDVAMSCKQYGDQLCMRRIGNKGDSQRTVKERIVGGVE